MGVKFWVKPAPCNYMLSESPNYKILKVRPCDVSETEHIARQSLRHAWKCWRLRVVYNGRVYKFFYARERPARRTVMKQLADVKRLVDSEYVRRSINALPSWERERATGSTQRLAHGDVQLEHSDTLPECDVSLDYTPSDSDDDDTSVSSLDPETPLSA